MPDLNSLPPSAPASYNRAMSANGEPVGGPGESPSPSPRASVSLQAAATVNAGLQHDHARRSSPNSTPRSRHSPHSGRRRSQVLMNLQLNDPSIPAPGEMVSEHSALGLATGSPEPFSYPSQPMAQSPLLLSRDPHHNRTPSLGELHQELESEQEAQVNRLLAMIRQQQQQLQQLQSQQSQSQLSENAIVESTDRLAQTSATQIPTGHSTPQSAAPLTGSLPRSPIFPHHPRSSFDMARADLQRRSRTPSRGPSPRLRSTSISAESGEQWVLGGRDESAFYQAETQMLVRENQMLRHRLRELEKQLAETNVASPVVGHEPSQHSNLTHSTSASEEDGTAVPRPRPSEPLPTVADAPKEE